MFENMLERIKKNAFKYNLSKPYQEYSQIELANEVMEHRYAEDIKVVIEHNGKSYELYTFGCKNTQDFLDKYRLVFEEIGLSYNTPVVESTPEVVVSEPENVENSNLDMVNNNTVVDNNINFFDMQVEKDDSFIISFTKMLNKKREINQEVKLNFNGVDINTADCNSVEDMVVKYSNDIINNYVEYYNTCLKDNDVKDAMWLFKTSRGNKYYGNEENKEQIASQIAVKEREYNLLFNKKNSIDFNNSQEVFEWVNSLIPYVNNHALALPVGLENSEYLTQDKLILAVLKDNGYTSQNISINNMDDFYKQFVSFQMQQLEKYGFFVTDYDSMTQEDLSLITERTKDEAKLLKYVDLLDRYENKLLELDEYENGNIGTNGGNFDKQIEKLTNEIEELKVKASNSESIEDISNDLSILYTIIDKTVVDKKLNDVEMKASSSFLDAYRLPTTENILIALNAAQDLDDNSKLKINLIDGITKLTRRYSSTLDDEEIGLIGMQLATIGVSLTPNSHLEDSIKVKEEEINKIKSIQEKRKNNGIASKAKINNNIIKLKEKINELNIKLEKVSIEPVQQVNNVVLENNDIVENDIELTPTQEKPFWENSKLSEIAAEGSIFTDASRIDEDHNWLSADNAKNLGHVAGESGQELVSDSDSLVLDKKPLFGFGKNKTEVTSNEVDLETVSENNQANEVVSEEIVQQDDQNSDVDLSSESNIDVSSNEIDTNDSDLDLVLSEEDLKKDSLFEFKPIKAVKNISKNLYDKISNINFKEKVKNAVEVLKKHAMPVIVSVGLPIIAAAGIVAYSNLDNINTPQASDDNQKEDTVEDNIVMGTIEDDIQNTLQNDNISFGDTTEDSTKISFEEQSQNVIDQTLTGESTVYTNAYDAFLGTNAVETSNLYAPSWENATVGDYYTVEDGNLEKISKDEASDLYQNGGNVIQQVENNGVGIGYVELENQQEQSSGMVK